MCYVGFTEMGLDIFSTLLWVCHVESLGKKIKCEGVRNWDEENRDEFCRCSHG